MSPLDWALVETWKNAGVPLEAALRGIDAAFEKWRAKKKRGQNVNSVAYCSQAVMTEAQAMAGVAPRARPQRIRRAVSHWRISKAISGENAAADPRSNQASRKSPPRWIVWRPSAALLFHDLEDLEHRLTALEDKMIALARSRQTEEDLFAPAANSISNFAPIAEK